MANKRTVFPILADTWVLVINSATAAKIYKSITTPTYYSFAGTVIGDAPATTIPNTPTAEKMFTGEDQLNEFVSDSAAVFLWVRCGPGQVGSVIVTL